MTDWKGDSGSERLDLRALDAGASASREDAIIQAALARITTRSVQPQWHVWMATAQRGLAAAALVSILLAGAMVFSRHGTGTRVDGTELIESWVASGQVPTNGELLAAYMGYRR
jgi:hypothetical protein